MAVLLAVALLLITHRRKRDTGYGILSTENPLEALAIAVVFGIILGFASLLVVPLLTDSVRGEDNTALAWSVFTTLVAAPVVVLFMLWKHLNDVHNRINSVIPLLGSERIEERLSSIYYLERIARESTSMFQTIVEMLCIQVSCRALATDDAGSQPSRSRQLELGCLFGMISRLWHHNLQSGRRLWNTTISWNPSIKGTDCSYMDLEYVCLIGFCIKDSFFRNTRLTKAALIGVSAEGADFSAADLRGAKLCDSSFQGAAMDGAQLDGAFLFHTNLSECKGLTEEQLSKAYGDESTVLPDGMKRPEKWKNFCIKGDDLDAGNCKYCRHKCEWLAVVCE